MKNIKKLTLTLTLLIIGSAVFGQDAEIRKLRDFTSISVSEGIEVIAEKGTENSAEIEYSRIDLDRIITEVRGGALSIHIDNDWFRRTSRHNVKIKLTYTEDPDRIRVNTAAELVFRSPVKGRRLDISTSTSGTVELKVDVSMLDLNASTSGTIEIEGVTEELKVGASTGGSIYAYEVEAKEASARANTGADVKISAEDYLSGRAGTGGSISYKGHPKTSVSTNTGGSVRRAN